MGDLSRLGNGERNLAKPNARKGRVSGRERVNVAEGRMRVGEKSRKQLSAVMLCFRFTPAMSVPKEDLLQAIELALASKWDAAHELVQQYENDATAAWIHAVLHKIEGDLGNSHYWYHRANRLEHAEDEPRAELATIRAELGQ
jgi:hypothetical protein